MPREAPVENPALLDALRGLNTGAVAADISAMESAGQLRENSESLQALALTLAMTLDLGAMTQTAPVAKELRATMAELRCDDNGDDDEGFLASLSAPMSTTVVDSPKPKPRNARPSGRRGDGVVGVTADAVAAVRS